MTLTLTNKTTYEVTKEEAEAVIAALQKGQKHVVLQGDFIMLNAIVAIQDDDRADRGRRLTAGQWQCQHNKWHNRGERCFGHDPELQAQKPTHALLDSGTFKLEEYTR